MKKLFALLFLMTLLPFVLAMDLEVTKLSNDETTLAETGKPILIDLSLKNNGEGQTFSFYTQGFMSFIDFQSGEASKTNFFIEKGETKNITLYLYQVPDSDLTGKIIFEYLIKSKSDQIEQRTLVNLATLSKSFDITSSNVDPETKQLTLYVKNKINYEFEEIDFKFSSPFFDKETTLSFKPYETKNFTITLDKKKFESLTSGFYTLNTWVEYEKKTSNIESKIEFMKKDLLNTTRKDTGFFIRNTLITKSNNGNTVLDSETIVERNIITRLFTTLSLEPTNIEREGSKINYIWVKKLNPGETIEIKATTNWFIPIIFIILFVAIIHYSRKYLIQKVAVRKKISYVRTKGGEFALKVTLIAEAREFVEDVKIIDFIPPIAKMYERFAGEFPDKISKDKRRLEWHYNYLDAGEKRIMNYVIYSKVGILGKFALPSAICKYKKEGKQREYNSNKAFFLSEQKGNFHKKF